MLHMLTDSIEGVQELNKEFHFDVVETIRIEVDPDNMDRVVVLAEIQRSFVYELFPFLIFGYIVFNIFIV